MIYVFGKKTINILSKGFFLLKHWWFLALKCADNLLNNLIMHSLLL